MKFNKKVWAKTALMAAVLSGSLISLQAGALTPVNPASTSTESCSAGLKDKVDFEKITVAPSDSVAQKMKKDVVIEFFSYACIHCANLYDPMVATLKSNPALTSQMVYVPAAFRPDWEEAARLYYAIEAEKLGSYERHSKIYAAAHGSNKDLFTNKKSLETYVNNLFGAKDGALVLARMKSFDVNSSVQQSKTLATKYQVDGTPLFVVDRLKGVQYKVSPALSKTAPRMLQVIGTFANTPCK